MHIGQYISGAAHVGLIGWALVGGVFRSTPPPFEVTGVSVVSVEEFNAAIAAQQSPISKTEVTVPQAPNLSQNVPNLTSKTDPVVPMLAVSERVPNAPDKMPDLSDITAPQPFDIEDVSPEMLPPDTDVAALLPRENVQPPATRVAPRPIARPDPSARLDESLREATRPDESAKTAKPQDDATAPEAATDRIATEANAKPEQKPLAPRQSKRPKARPANQPASSTDAGVNAALAEALADEGAQTRAETSAAPSGPPLTGSEKESLRVSVQRCWNVNVGSAADQVSVTVKIALDRNGKVKGGVTLLGSTGGDAKAVNIAFEAARRAVLRCQNTGYKLPADKYEQWRDIEMTFNPEKMRRK